jgi:hypothetical protein
MMARPIQKTLAWTGQPSIGRPVRPVKSMLTEYKAARLHNSCLSPHGANVGSTRRTETQLKSKLLVQALMFPETDEISNIISDTLRVVFKRRLIDRVLRLWTEMARGRGFPRRDQIEPSRMSASEAIDYGLAYKIVHSIEDLK